MLCCMKTDVSKTYKDWKKGANGELNNVLTVLKGQIAIVKDMNKDTNITTYRRRIFAPFQVVWQR